MGESKRYAFKSYNCLSLEEMCIGHTQLIYLKRVPYSYAKHVVIETKLDTKQLKKLHSLKHGLFKIVRCKSTKEPIKVLDSQRCYLPMFKSGKRWVYSMPRESMYLLNIGDCIDFIMEDMGRDRKAKYRIAQLPVS